MSAAANTPVLHARTALAGTGKPRCRAIVPPGTGARSEPAIFEWELRGEAWTDLHPHSEYNFVIEGRLCVEAGGVVVEAGVGELVHVPAGTAGRYWAPQYARLLAIYGPTDGTPSQALGYEPRSPAMSDSEPQESRAATSPQRRQGRQLFGDIAPKFAELTDDVLFGDVWARSGLSRRDRSLATCSALIALNRPEQLRAHLALALENGLTEEELAELFTHLAFYAGWPSAVTVIAVAREVFVARRKRGASEPKP